MGAAPPPELVALGRRAFLSAAALAVGGCAVKSNQASSEAAVSEDRIAIIGGGLAGLTCAYWLSRAGVAATVYEASKRTGGRIYTMRGELPEPLFAELGGEFIAPEHATMFWLASALEISLRAYEVTPGQRVFWMGNRRVPEEELLEELEGLLTQLTEELEGADESAEKLAKFDATPLARWLEGALRSDTGELLALLNARFRAEFGLEPESQSALNLLSLIGRSGNVNGFERSLAYTAMDGADLFAQRLESQLLVPVRRESRLVAVRRKNATTYTLSFESPTGLGFQVDAERLVLALPFSVLRKVDLREAGLSQGKLGLINQLSYGAHSKLVAAFSTRSWSNARRVLSDRPFQLVWDSTVNHPTPNGLGLLSNLVGGRASGSAVSADSAMLQSIADLDLALATSLGYLAGSARRIRWTNALNFEGSVSSPTWGKWLIPASAGVPEGNVHFCGEHTSIDFRGSMEGAAESGTLVASQILEDLALSPPDGLDALVALKARAPVAQHRAEEASRMRPLARRRSVLEAHAEFLTEKELL